MCGATAVAERVPFRASVTPLIPRGDEFTARYEIQVPACADHAPAVRTGRRRARGLVLVATAAGAFGGLVLGALITGSPIVAGALALTGMIASQVAVARATAPLVDLYAYSDRLELHLSSAEVAAELAESSGASLMP